MSKIIDRIQEKAEALRTVRQEIDAIKEASRVALEEKEVMREKLQGELIASFNKEGLTSIKVSTGETYSKATRKGLTVTSEVFALDWAIKARAVSINKIIAAQMLKDAAELPAGFERSEIEYISVRKPKSKDEAEPAKE